MRTVRDWAIVVVACLVSAAIAFALLAPRSWIVAAVPFTAGSDTKVEAGIPRAGQVVHAQYRLKRNLLDGSGSQEGWGSVSQNTETWWLIGTDRLILKIYNRVTDDDKHVISEVFFDGNGKMFQYWNQRDELWIDTDNNPHSLEAWTAEAIDQELTKKGFVVAGERQIAGQQARIFELQTKDKLPSEWLARLAPEFQAGHLVRRVFIGQSPIKGLDLGHEDVIANQSGAETIGQSYLLVSWKVEDSISQAGDPFAWAPPLAKTVRDMTHPK